MTNSKTISKSTWDRYVKLVLEVVESSVDRNGNYSMLDWNLKLANDTAWAFNFSPDALAEVWIDDKTVYSKYHSFDTRNGTVNLASGSVKVPHNNNGSKTVQIYARMLDISTLGNIEWFGENFTLTDIARSSTAGTVSITNLSAPITVNINRTSDSYTHQVWYKMYGSSWIDLGKGLGTSVTFTPDPNLASRIPNANQGPMDICVRTYEGTTQIGEDEYTYNYNVPLPSSAKPSLGGITLTETYHKLKDISTSDIFVQTLSIIGIKFDDVSGYMGSTISSYYAEVVDANNSVSGDNSKFKFFDKHGNFRIRAYVTDSRGNKSNEIMKDITVLEYHAPIASIYAIRSGERNDTITVYRNVKIAPITINGQNKNTLSMSFQTKQTTEQYWNNNIGGALKNMTVDTLINSAVNLTGSFSPEFAFHVRATISDKFIDGVFAEAPSPVPSEKVLISYTPDGLGVGKIRENGMLDVDGEIFSRGKLVQYPAITKPDGRTKRLIGSANTAIIGGMYATDNMTNLPNGVNKTGYLTVINHHSLNTYLVQYYTPMDKDEIWMRRMIGNTWTNWVLFAPTSADTSPKWVNVSTRGGWSSEGLQVSKDKNTVYFRGNISGNSAGTSWGTQVIFIPEGYRPSKDLYMACMDYDYNPTTLYVRTNGYVEIRKYSSSNKWIGFDGNSYVI